MQVQTELGSDLNGSKCAEVLSHPREENGPVRIFFVAGEGLPMHLNGAAIRLTLRWRLGSFSQRQTECPW